MGTLGIRLPSDSFLLQKTPRRGGQGVRRRVGQGLDRRCVHRVAQPLHCPSCYTQELGSLALAQKSNLTGVDILAKAAADLRGVEPAHFTILLAAECVRSPPVSLSRLLGLEAVLANGRYIEG